MDHTDSIPSIECSENQWAMTDRDNDLTFFWEKDKLPVGVTSTTNSELNTFVKGLNEALSVGNPAKHRFDGNISLSAPGKDPLKCRANIVRCNAGQALSATFRVSSRPESNPRPLGGEATNPLPVEYEEYSPRNQDHAVGLSKLIFPRALDAPPHGAVVFSGATNSKKSAIARSFVKALLSMQMTKNNKRYPHLVTVEEPIELWSYKKTKSDEYDLSDPEVSAKLGLCVTARNIGADVFSIKDALIDARRQTPTCVFIGEVRNPEEWKYILDFAGSGHLVVATTHAASVRETVARLMAACEANTPAERRQWAGYIRGIIHLKYDNGILPSVWVGDPAALNSLVSVGLSSVSPNHTYHHGRLSYIDWLLKQRELDATSKKALTAQRQKAKDIDLQELQQQ